MTVSTDLHSSVKTKVEQLINQCENLRKDNQDLQSRMNMLVEDKNQLNSEVESLQAELGKCNQHVMELNHRVEVLKNAETLSRSDEQSAEVKSRINDLMREIDNCIALLSK